MQPPVWPFQRLPLLIGACAGAFLLVSAACSGNEGATALASSTTPAGSAPAGTGTLPASPTRAGTSPSASADNKTEPVVAAPASKYTILQDDVGTGFLTDIKDTYVLDAAGYAKTRAFDKPEDGQAMLEQWGYAGGYESALTPEGGDTAILNGAFAISIESHLFKDAGGAKQAYAYFVNRIRANKPQSVSIDGVGNESGAWKLIVGKIGSSSTDRAIHEIVFRRGNLVALVVTIGADPLMKVDTVRALANLVDQKALGTKQAVEPTPTSNYTPPAYTSATSQATPPATPTRAR